MSRLIFHIDVAVIFRPAMSHELFIMIDCTRFIYLSSVSALSWSRSNTTFTFWGMGRSR